MCSSDLWQLPVRQSQPESPEVTEERSGAHQTAAQSCGRRHSRERCYKQDWRARIQSPPQTDVARHSRSPSQNLTITFQYLFSHSHTHPVQRSSPEGSLVHALDEIVTTTPPLVACCPQHLHLLLLGLIFFYVVL